MDPTNTNNEISNYKVQKTSQGYTEIVEENPIKWHTVGKDTPQISKDFSKDTPQISKDFSKDTPQISKDTPQKLNKQRFTFYDD